MITTTVLDKVNSAKDINSLTIDEMKQLSEEMRELIIKKVNTIGGHMAPNLGIVEPTIALHYVFNSPEDKFVFDVSHQCYTHKILTGRKDGFLSKENYLKYTGYTAPEESEHDIFKVGHTSTAASLATGIAKARDLRGEKYNVVAIIGDGSLSGGEAFEGLNNAADLNSNIIMLINDNEMSIAENSGGMYRNLEELRNSNGQAECNFFKSLGYKYYYLDDGNNLEKLIALFKEVKDTTCPVVVHIHTLKGKGLQPAVENKEMFHWMLPNTLDNYDKPAIKVENYHTVTTDYILSKAENDKTIFAITPATPGAYGFTKDFRAKLGKQYVDVGIAEEHAVAFASAAAKHGAKPILAVISSFLQRTYDQFSQDLCLNNSPATVVVYWGGISPMDATHVGSFDIPMISNIPNLVYLAPTCKEEYLAMLDWSVEQTQYPVAIRVPFANYIVSNKSFPTNYSSLNKYEITRQGKDVAIIGLGDFYHLGENVADLLKNELGLNATLINPRYITGLDKDILENLKTNHKVVITLENGVLDGGFGEKISRYYGGSNVKVLNFGGEKEFTDRVSLEELYQRYHLTPELILEDLKKCL